MLKPQSAKMLPVLFAIILVLSPLSYANASDSSAATRINPPASGVYHAAFPDFGGLEDDVTPNKIADFITLAGKRIVWAYFSNNWFDGIEFPEASVRIIHEQGIVPFIRIMARSRADEVGPDPVYTLQRIIRGDFDPNLHRWAQRARAAAIPLLVEFGTEVNGDWFPWSGVHNGGAETRGYGDPLSPDGPERFRDAYRHIVDIARLEGADNIAWVLHVNGDSVPQEPWNTMAAYYPGDDYVDWIGVSVYGSLRPGEEWHLFSELMDSVYPELAAISKQKPLAVLEYGVVDDPKTGDKASWIHDALQSIKQERYPRIKAMSYWHENWINEDGTISHLRLDSSPQALAAYREEISEPFFVETPVAGNITTTRVVASTSNATRMGNQTAERKLGLYEISVLEIAGLFATAVAVALVAVRLQKNRKHSSP